MVGFHAPPMSINMKKKIISHLKDDIKTFKEEAAEDKVLIKQLKSKKKHNPKKKSSKKRAKSHEKKESKGEKKIEKVMREFKGGKLHSGSKKGPKVTSRKQAIAIALSEAGRSKKR